MLCESAAPDSDGITTCEAVIPATASGNIWEAVQTVAVRNYREMKSDMGQSFRKVTGQNKAQDRWVKGINKARVGVQVAGALAAFQDAKKGAQGRQVGHEFAKTPGEQQISFAKDRQLFLDHTCPSSGAMR